jgi:uncharacterized glyoxalase superfamily protein PhnB
MNAIVYPTLRYSDADAAMAWLAQAFGFEAGGVYRDDAGRVAHADLWLDGAAIMIGEGDDAGGETYVAVDDLEGIFRRAMEAGAELTRDLGSTEYGSREFSARDLAGRVWHFGTYRPTPVTG